MKKSLVIVLVSFYSIQIGACEKWSTPQKIGELNRKLIFESSGVAQSSFDDNRLYHINDSGDSARFIMSDLEGKNSKSIGINDFSPKDVEDIDVGPCENETCLFIGDIGDNRKKRKYIKVISIKEKEKFSKTVNIHRKLILRYPDRAHNAEGMAIHPTGDLYIVTKESRYFFWSRDAKIFKLAAKKVEQGGEHILEYVGKIRTTRILKKYKRRGKLITGFDIHPSGNKFLLLSYTAAIEFDTDLNQSPDFSHYTLIPLKKLKQQEAIHYTQEGEGFIYTTESKKKNSPILEVSCLE